MGRVNSKYDDRGKDKTPCEMRIYFAWSGTDKNGKVLNSHESRFSAFPPETIVNDARNAFD